MTPTDMQKQTASNDELSKRISALETYQGALQLRIGNVERGVDAVNASLNLVRTELGFLGTTQNEKFSSQKEVMSAITSKIELLLERSDKTSDHFFEKLNLTTSDPDITPAGKILSARIKAVDDRSANNEASIRELRTLTNDQSKFQNEVRAVLALIKWIGLPGLAILLIALVYYGAVVLKLQP